MKYYAVHNLYVYFNISFYSGNRRVPERVAPWVLY